MRRFMRTTLKTVGLAITTMATVTLATFAPQAAAQVTFYERESFEGRSFTAKQTINNFQRSGFNDRASSAVVTGERWEVCEDRQFRGDCVVLRPGRYPSLRAMGLNDRVSSVKAISRNTRIDDSRYAPMPAPDVPQVVFFEHEGFQGRSFTSDRPVADFNRFGFNDRASSAVVLGERWEVCDNARFSGRCVVLRPGRYASLSAMGMNDRASSARVIARSARIDDSRYAPAPVAAYDNRRRRNEQLYEANVTSARAVLGTPEQRCWVEQEQVTVERGGPSVAGGIAGAIIGGILGHQVGGGRGQDIATVGGAVAGAAVGANVGRTAGSQQTQDVQRCESVPSRASPDYWDVTYTFQGREHRVQMTTQPGRTIRVNGQGEPRA